MAAVRGDCGGVLGGSSHGLTAPDEAGGRRVECEQGLAAAARSCRTESLGAVGSSKAGIWGGWSFEAVFTAPPLSQPRALAALVALGHLAGHAMALDEFANERRIELRPIGHELLPFVGAARDCSSSSINLRKAGSMAADLNPPPRGHFVCYQPTAAMRSCCRRKQSRSPELLESAGLSGLAGSLAAEV